MSVVKRYFT